MVKIGIIGGSGLENPDILKAPEAILANEIGIPYAVIAMSTDYDSWKENEAPVSWEEVIAVFNKNIGNVLHLILKVIQDLK